MQIRPSSAGLNAPLSLRDTYSGSVYSSCRPVAALCFPKLATISVRRRRGSTFMMLLVRRSDSVKGRVVDRPLLTRADLFLSIWASGDFVISALRINFARFEDYGGALEQKSWRHRVGDTSSVTSCPKCICSPQRHHLAETFLVLRARAEPQKPR